MLPYPISTIVEEIRHTNSKFSLEVKKQDKADVIRISSTSVDSAELGFRCEDQWRYFCITGYRGGFEFTSDNEDEVHDIVEICTSLCTGSAEIEFTVRRRGPILRKINTPFNVFRAEIGLTDAIGKRGRVVPAPW